MNHQIDPTGTIERSSCNVSNIPVVTARYYVEIVMNEDEYGLTDDEHKELLAKELQRAMDNGYFEDIRYDQIEFRVASREVLHTAPAGEPEQTNS